MQSGSNTRHCTHFDTLVENKALIFFLTICFFMDIIRFDDLVAPADDVDRAIPAPKTLRSGERQRETGATQGAGIDIDPAIVHRHDSPHNGQAQTKTARIGVATLVDAEEGLEDLCSRCLGDAGSIVV